MLSDERDPSQAYEDGSTENYTTTTSESHLSSEHSTAHSIPRITIHDPDQAHARDYESGSATETEMSSSHSHERSSGSISKKHSKSKSKKDDWSKITDPEERRRVQNRIAQRKFRDKAKEAKERQERDATNLAHAHASYHVPSPSEMSAYSSSPNLSGLPWGSLSLLHVVTRGHAKESESRRGGSGRSYSHSSSVTTDPRSQQQSLDGRSPYEVAEATFGEEMELGSAGPGGGVDGHSGADEDGLFEEGGWDDGDRGGAYYGYAMQGGGGGGGDGSGASSSGGGSYGVYPNPYYGITT